MVQFEFLENFNSLNPTFINIRNDIIADRFSTIQYLPNFIQNQLQRQITKTPMLKVKKDLTVQAYAKKLKGIEIQNNIIVGGVGINTFDPTRKLLETPFFDDSFNIVNIKKFHDVQIKSKHYGIDSQKRSYLDFAIGKQIFSFDAENQFNVNMTASGYYQPETNKVVLSFVDEILDVPVAYALADEVCDRWNTSFNLKITMRDKTGLDPIISRKIQNSFDTFLVDGDQKYKMKSYISYVFTDLIGFLCWYFRSAANATGFIFPEKRKELQSPGLKSFMANIVENKESLLAPFPVFRDYVEKLRNVFNLDPGELKDSQYVAFLDQRFSPPLLIGISLRNSNVDKIENKPFNISQHYTQQVNKYFFQYRLDPQKTIYLGPRPCLTSKYEDAIFLHDQTQILQRPTATYVHFPIDTSLTDEMYSNGRLDYQTFLL